MPVRRFRSVEEMNRPEWRTPGDPRLYEVIREIWTTGERMNRRRFRPGVRRYRSIEEMQDDRMNTTVDW